MVDYTFKTVEPFNQLDHKARMLRYADLLLAASQELGQAGDGISAEYTESNTEKTGHKSKMRGLAADVGRLSVEAEALACLITSEYKNKKN